MQVKNDVGALLFDALAMRARCAPNGLAPCVITWGFWDEQAREIACFILSGGRES